MHPEAFPHLPVSLADRFYSIANVALHVGSRSDTMERSDQPDGKFHIILWNDSNTACSLDRNSIESHALKHGFGITLG